jgi:hypothetical protein
LLGQTIPNASRTAADNSDETVCWTMNTCSAHQYTMDAPAQILRNWREQRPSSQGDVKPNVAGRLAESVTRGGPASGSSHAFYTLQLME